MGSLDPIRRQADTTIIQGFTVAVRRMVEEVQLNSATPLRDGGLREGIERGSVVSVTGPRKTAKIVSTTTNRGFDYPAYLNARTRRYLNGNSNVHQDWWNRVVTLELWTRLLREEINLGR